MYISHVKDGTNQDDTFMMEEQNAELQAAVMDLTAEDKDGEIFSHSFDPGKS